MNDPHIKRFIAELKRLGPSRRKVAKPVRSIDPVAAMAAELERLNKAESKPADEFQSARERFIAAFQQSGNAVLQAAE